jgi:alkylation response protein AidB-like acyl-CoA dehydrogenase
VRNHRLLTEEQRNRYDEFCSFVRSHVEPAAAAWDRARELLHEILKLCGETGFTGGILPRRYGGGEWDAVTFGLLNEAFGAASSALCGLFTVQSMVGTTMACIIRSGTPGIKVTPLKDMLGFKAAHLARIEFDNCEVRPGEVVGKPGLVIQYVAPYGLHWGRISTAWSALGLIRACVRTAAAFALERRVSGGLLVERGMFRQMMADMGVDMDAAGELCLSACLAEDAHSPRALEKALAAKYFASRAAVRAAANTVQIMGAAGCHEENSAARYYRDAKIMEIIEGTNQVMQTLLGQRYCKRYGRNA